ncbi:MAG TPA: DUF2244 domain-containing protein [Alphaproteobacteria bacterium]|nr:DUF2244 domain-containing protein [Alphaproteobacteria bacterium]
MEMPPAEPPPAGAAPVYFDAVLQQNRSLSMVGAFIVLGVAGAFSFSIAALFASIGAWPVLGFCGLDILLLWLALRHAVKAPKPYETVRLDSRDLRVRRVDAKGRAREWTFQPYWVQVGVQEPNELETHVTLSSHGRTLPVALCLSPPEKRDFAEALKAALRRWREGGRAP